MRLQYRRSKKKKSGKKTNSSQHSERSLVACHACEQNTGVEERGCSMEKTNKAEGGARDLSNQKKGTVKEIGKIQFREDVPKGNLKNLKSDLHV